MHAPAAESHESVVHGLPSRQSRAVPPTQPLVASQVPPVVQKSVAQSASLGACAQPLARSLRAGLQVSTVHPTVSAHMA